MVPRKIRPGKEKGKKIAGPRQTRKVAPKQQNPIFSLVHLRKDYCLSSCTKDEKAAFADTLHRLSQLTWNQIGSSSRHGLGYERISQDAIRSGLPSHIKDDVNFIAFRFFGKAPMVGYRDENVFHIVWIDRTFTLYDHG